jgi:hypothetical protein
MFSLQTIFGSGKQFYTLLDEAAQAAFDSAKALHAMMREADRLAGAGRVQAGPPPRARGL